MMTTIGRDNNIFCPMSPSFVSYQCRMMATKTTKWLRQQHMMSVSPLCTGTRASFCKSNVHKHTSWLYIASWDGDKNNINDKREVSMTKPCFISYGTKSFFVSISSLRDGDNNSMAVATTFAINELLICLISHRGMVKTNNKVPYGTQAHDTIILHRAMVTTCHMCCALVTTTTTAAIKTSYVVNAPLFPFISTQGMATTKGTISCASTWHRDMVATYHIVSRDGDDNNNSGNNEQWLSTMMPCVQVYHLSCHMRATTRFTKQQHDGDTDVDKQIFCIASYIDTTARYPQQQQWQHRTMIIGNDALCASAPLVVSHGESNCWDFAACSGKWFGLNPLSFGQGAQISIFNS